MHYSITFIVSVATIMDVLVLVMAVRQIVVETTHKYAEDLGETLSTHMIIVRFSNIFPIKPELKYLNLLNMVEVKGSD